MTAIARTKSLHQVVSRLSELSLKGHQDPYNSIKWPDAIGETEKWMSDDLLSICGVSDICVSDEQKRALGKWESVHFYSLNIHGIRELMTSVIARMYQWRHRDAFQFLHHFIDEENQHMWFFAEFCQRYGGKIYPNIALSTWTPSDPKIDDLVSFIRITLFEEMVDVYNVRMGQDKTLAPIVQQINAMHHVDESRHIAFGRRLVEFLFEEVQQSCSASDIFEMQDYIGRYINYSLRSLCSAYAYRDAGFKDPVKIRDQVLSSESYRDRCTEMVSRSVKFARPLGLISNDWEVDLHV